MSASSDSAGAGEAAERGDGQQRRVGADVRIELRAEARQRLVNLDRRSVAAALVQHVDGDRREPFLPGRIVGRAASRRAASASTTGIDGWRTVQTRRPLGSTDFSIAGK